MVSSSASSTGSTPASKEDETEEIAAKFSRLKSPTKEQKEIMAPSASSGVVRNLLAVQSGPVGMYEQEKQTMVENRASAPCNTLVPYPAVRSLQAARTGTGTGMELVVPTEGVMVKHKARVYTLGDGETLTGEQYMLIKREQRTPQNLWKAEWAYPTGSVMERASYMRVKEFLCYGMNGCKNGRCCKVFETNDVYEIRRRFSARAAEVLARKVRSAGGHDSASALLDVLHSDLLPHWDGVNFGLISVRLSEYVSVNVCSAAYAFLAGVKGSSAQTVFSRINTSAGLSGPLQV
jgi:hypothetical protein